MKKILLSVALAIGLTGCSGWDVPNTPPEKMTCKQLNEQMLFYSSTITGAENSTYIGQDSQKETIRMLMKKKGC